MVCSIQNFAENVQQFLKCFWKLIYWFIFIPYRVVTTIMKGWYPKLLFSNKSFSDGGVLIPYRKMIVHLYIPCCSTGKTGTERHQTNFWALNPLLNVHSLQGVNTGFTEFSPGCIIHIKVQKSQVLSSFSLLTESSFIISAMLPVMRSA